MHSPRIPKQDCVRSGPAAISLRMFLRTDVLRDPQAAPESMSGFLSTDLNTAAMAAQVKPALHRQRVEHTKDVRWRM